MKFKIITLGCKVNTYESEYMLESLLDSGYIYDDLNPDIIIINTCSVTNVADNKSLKIVRKIKRENVNKVLVVVGCSVQNNKDKYANLGINILLGNRKKAEIVELLHNYFKSKQNYFYCINDRQLDFENMKVKRFTTHTRAFLKIQDGCDNFCSYCIIPFLRGSTRSKNFDDAIAETKNLVANHHQEIVLTGIHTGSYNCNGKDLTDLIHELSKIDNLKRIRISSIEITELNDKFLNELKVNPKICDHLHIPLQSGSDNVLRKMNRKYDTAYFKDKINKIRAIRPNISITTDCIVGYPYENDNDFLDYIAFCQEIGFSKLHVFPYSVRSNTAAALMPQVDGKIKKERVQKLLQLSKLLEANYAQKFCGQKLVVLTEQYENGETVGFTSNYLKVHLQGEYLLNNEYLCDIIKVVDNVLIGVVVTCINN